MISSRYSVRLTAALVGTLATMLALAATLLKTNYVIIPVLLGAALIGQALGLFRLVNASNRMLQRFFEGATQGDFSASFGQRMSGAGFAELGHAMDQVVNRFHQDRTEQQQQLHYMRALLDEVPVPLLTVTDHRQVKLINQAARKLFNGQPIGNIADLNCYGETLARAIVQQAPGPRQLVTVEGHEAVDRVAVSVTELSLNDGRQRLVSLTNIQSELEATELEAWQKLVRVLTHEIMNSVTPIASLAQTASDLIEQSDQAAATVEPLRSVHQAVDTVASRSNRLIDFVSSYRSLTRMPKPNPQSLPVSHLFGEMIRLKQPELKRLGVSISQDVEPADLSVLADADLLEQLLINLITNASEALTQTTQPAIRLRGSLDRASRPVICVEDNGPGIPSELSEQIFVPFFTTKRTGTGVGLALARQIMRAHGGRLLLERHADGGTAIKAVFGL